MDDALKEYLQSIEEAVTKYKNNELKTKESLQSIEDIKQWLEERCNEDPHN